MTQAKLRSLLDSLIGQGTEVGQGDKDLWLEAGQDKTELAHPWKFLRQSLPAQNTVVGDKDWDLPADYREMRVLKIGDDLFAEISEEESFDWDGDTNVFFVNWNPATSRFQINLLEAPTAVKAITGSYLRTLPALSTTSYESPVYNPMSIVYGAFELFQGYNEEPDLALKAERDWRKTVDQSIEIDRGTATTSARMKSNAADYGHVRTPAHLR